MPTTMRADALRNEAEFLPAALSDLVELRRRIIDAGYPPSVANGLVGWLVSKTAGERDVTGSPTRSKYRKILAELDSGSGPGRGRRKGTPDDPRRLGGDRAAAHNPRYGRYVKLPELVGRAA